MDDGKYLKVFQTKDQFDKHRKSEDFKNVTQCPYARAMCAKLEIKLATLIISNFRLRLRSHNLVRIV